MYYSEIILDHQIKAERKLAEQETLIYSHSVNNVTFNAKFALEILEPRFS